MDRLQETVRLIRSFSGYMESPRVQFPNDDSIVKALASMKLNTIPDPEEEGMVLVDGPTNAVDLWWTLKPQDDFFGPICKFRRTLTNAVIPSKTHGSDVGYDLTVVFLSQDVITRHRRRLLYDTGIQLEIPYGYYIEIVPRSSFSKTGWMLTNSVGIIDPSYRGNLMVSITQLIDNAPQLELPFRGFQLIVRRQEHMRFIEVASDEDLPNTVRADGAFGSTGSSIEDLDNYIYTRLK